MVCPEKNEKSQFFGQKFYFFKSDLICNNFSHLIYKVLVFLLGFKVWKIYDNTPIMLNINYFNFIA